MIPYPTKEEVLAADREQVYRWFLLLPFPRYVKDKQTKVYVQDPQGGQEIMNLVFKRWKELGGSDSKMVSEIMREVVHATPTGPDATRSKDNVVSTTQGV